MLENMQEGTYVVAVSGGPDSMALLHMALMKQLPIVVCHVNYHKRESSNRDETIVRSFCALHEIRCEVLHASGSYEGNFQSHARKIRYEFFLKIYKQVNAIGLLCAHHRDDHLETALLRQEQGRKVSYYGIRKETVILGMRVVRPLLHVWKHDLVVYCKQNEVPFGIDETNESVEYDRNRIRNSLLSNVGIETKNEWIESFEEQNKLLEKKRVTCNFILKQLKYKEQLPLHILSQCDDKEALLRIWLTSLHELSFSLSAATIKQVAQLAISTEGHKQVDLFDQFVVMRIYDTLHFINQHAEVTYCYALDQIKEFETPWFKVQLMGSLREGISVTKQDFPLSIRNARAGDSIHLSFGHKKLSRYFIDQKIPLNQRKTWPVVCNNKNEVIFACGIGSSYEYFTNTPNLFVVK